MKLILKKHLTSGILIQFLLAATLGFVYWHTLLPGLGYSGDTAKFQYVGYVLGTPHWPGYPAYIMINYLFTHLFPIGTIAFKANLLSAILAVCSCLTLFNILRKIFLVDLKASFTASFLFGVSFTMWSQSVVAEVYTLAMLFLGLFLFFLFSWRRTGSRIYFLTACAVYAFSFGNHLWMIILLPGFVYFIFATNKKIVMRPSILFLLLIIVILAALQYGYVIWRYYAGSPYLEITAPDIKSFFNSINQMEVKTQLHFSIPKLFVHRIPIVLFFLIREFSILLPLSIFGLKQVWKKDGHIAYFIAICCICNICFIMFYNIYDIFIYMLITYFLFALCCGLGIEFFIKNKFLKRFANTAYIVLWTVIIAIMIYNSRYVSMRHSTDKIAKTRNILRSVKEDAIIFTTGYFTTQCLNYYLIGNDIAAKRNIHVFDQIFYPNNIFLYLKKGVPLINPKQPGVKIAPGLNVYVAMPFLKPEQVRHQMGVKFFHDYYRNLVNLNNFTKKFGAKILPESYENISFPTRLEQKMEIVADTLSDIEKLGMNAIEITEDLYLITIKEDNQKPLIE